MEFIEFENKNIML